MNPLKAFVARSFSSEDNQKIDPILTFLDSFKKVGFDWCTAESADVERVSDKVRKLIDSSDALIAIITRRHAVYECGSRWRKPVLKTWTAPPWLLQESGYALKSEIPILFLVEKNVELPMLQGDLEYIPFDSGNMQPTFQKVSEWVNSLIARKGHITVRNEVLIASPTNPEPPSEVLASEKSENVQEKISDEPDLVAIYSKMSEAIKRNDLQDARTLFETGLSKIESSEDSSIDSVIWECLYLADLFELDQGAFTRLRDLSASHPDRHEPLQELGSCYFAFSEYQKAFESWDRAANLCESHARARLLSLCAEALLEEKKYDEVIPRVREALTLDPLSDRLADLLYRALKGPSPNRDVSSFAFAESFLRDKPDAALRFSLGRDYQDAGLDGLAMFHFKTMVERSPDNGGACNNFGVSAALLGLPILSVNLYKRAIKEGELLGTSNLAYRYLEHGFADEALGLVQAVLKDSPAGTHENIDTCLSDVSERRHKESEKEKEIYSDAEALRGFLADFGTAMWNATIPPIEGAWAFPVGVIPVTTNGENLSGECEVQGESLQSLFSSGLAAGRQSKKCILSGRLWGRVAKLAFRIRSESSPASVFAAIDDTYDGYVVFSEDGTKGRFIKSQNKKWDKPVSISKK